MPADVGISFPAADPHKPTVQLLKQIHAGQDSFPNLQTEFSKRRLNKITFPASEMHSTPPPHGAAGSSQQGKQVHAPAPRSPRPRAPGPVALGPFESPACAGEPPGMRGAAAKGPPGLRSSEVGPCPLQAARWDRRHTHPHPCLPSARLHVEPSPRDPEPANNGPGPPRTLVLQLWLPRDSCPPGPFSWEAHATYLRAGQATRNSSAHWLGRELPQSMRSAGLWP